MSFFFSNSIPITLCCLFCVCTGKHLVFVKETNKAAHLDPRNTIAAYLVHAHFRGTVVWWAPLSLLHCATLIWNKFQMKTAESVAAVNECCDCRVFETSEWRGWDQLRWHSAKEVKGTGHDMVKDCTDTPFYMFSFLFPKETMTLVMLVIPVSVYSKTMNNITILGERKDWHYFCKLANSEIIICINNKIVANRNIRSRLLAR